MPARLLSLASQAPWVTSALVIAVVVLFIEQRADDTAATVLEGHFNAVATSPIGGVLFLLSPVDCIETRDTVAQLAATALEKGLVVRALVIEDGVDPVDLRALLDDANRRFPHYPVPMRAAALFGNMFRIRRTPMMLTANGTTGTITVLPSVTSDGLSLAFSDEEEF